MFTNLDFIHTRICYGFLNENNHQEYSVLLAAVSLVGVLMRIWSTVSTMNVFTILIKIVIKVLQEHKTKFSLFKNVVFEKNCN
jgi:hypothetical protein